MTTEQEQANQYLLTASALIEGEIETETWAGDLFLTTEEGSWQVHKRASMGTDELIVYLDTIQPEAFASARVLAAYFQTLAELDGTTVDLPDDVENHIGAVLE